MSHGSPGDVSVGHPCIDGSFVMIIQQSAGPMTESLHAPGPDAEHQAKLMQFGCLVGSWDLDVVYYDE